MVPGASFVERSSRLARSFVIRVHMAVKDSLEYLVPLVVHGDDADAHRRRSFNVLTISSALTTGSPWDCKLLVYAMDNSKACTESFDTLNAWVVWSLTELQEGRWMSVDPWDRVLARPHERGAVIAGPYRGVVVQIKGDEKWLQKALKLVPSGTSHWVCPICRACKDGEFVYTAFGPFAPHRMTRLTTAEFIQEASRGGPWTRLPGFALDLLAFDWLHLVDLTIIPECSASAARNHRSFSSTSLSQGPSRVDAG